MNGKKILVAPLDWGLGHATRCIPVIRGLLKAGHEVLIAGDGQVALLLVEEFPQLKLIPLRGYRLRYSAILPAWLKTFFMLPKIIFRMWVEHTQLKKIIHEEQIDVVISDNRFGLWNKKICSVYITHQVMIRFPGGLKVFEPIGHSLHQWIIQQYDHCWIPDYEGVSNLSGDLSHAYRLPKNARFINPLSRFTFNGTEKNYDYDLCFVISGPEPSRTGFEKIIVSELKGYTGKAIVILGRPGNNRDETCGNTRVVSHLDSTALEKIIATSKMVVCRAGYSGIMDLVAMKKDALLIPTPGQTEQEYLAAYLSSKKIFGSITQSHFRIDGIVAPSNKPLRNSVDEDQQYSPLTEAINELRSVDKIAGRKNLVTLM